MIEYLDRYLAAGIALLPLHTAVGGRCSCLAGDRCDRSPGKHPRTANGKDDATTDLGQIAEWLARWPHTNWGGRPPVGQFVLDVDPRNGGMDTLAALELEHGPILPTRTARTGSGGLHYWVAYDGPVLGKLGRGLDIKSNSGYLVLPPSVHPCGGRYEWIDRHPVADAPEWMIQALTPRVRLHTGGGGGIAGLARWLTTVTEEGDRNNRLYWAARRAVDEGIDPWLLRPAAEFIGLGPVEIERTLNSAARNGA